MAQTEEQFDAWNPGLTSEIPAFLLPQVTLYRPENSETTYAEAKDAAELCGRRAHEMAALKASRLATHEILIRVTADLFVPDGPNYEELGLNLRGMADRITTTYVQPKMEQIERDFAQIRADVEERLEELLARDIYPGAPAATEKAGIFSRLFGKKKQAPQPQEAPEIRGLSEWKSQLLTVEPAFEHACLEGLYKIVAGIVGRRGRLLADKELVIRLAANWICNSYGSKRIGEMIDPIIREAASAEGYRFLPFQKAPVVLNVKGASAAGKSTIRPLQRKLAERLDVPWEDFALISPDYWRKFMLDYDSVGKDYKYAAMLTGQELEIIDKKLDDYVEEKAERGEIPHLLIDRFRFDSFVPAENRRTAGRLLSRFGHTVFLFFIITPPADTVERAWHRGRNTGRFKAVDDLLYHNIEAYTGMPALFFTWVKKEQQKVHFEFLDNDVPLGDLPKTVAFGWNDTMTVLDIDCMRRLSKYQRINVDARTPEDVLLESDGDVTDIMLDCVHGISDVTFVHPESLEIRGHTQNGLPDFEVDGFFAKSSLSPIYNSELSQTAALEKGSKPTLNVEYEKNYTVGAWADT